MKIKLNENTKVKYIDFENYNKHFSLESRIEIQKIISEHRDETGKLTILLMDIGNMLQNDPSTISKEVKKHRIYKPRHEYETLPNLNSICSLVKANELGVGFSNSFDIL